VLSNLSGAVSRLPLAVLVSVRERKRVVARKETVHLIDDLDGTEATTSVTFAVNGVE